MLPLLHHGWKWQYISINGAESKPRFYFSGVQLLGLGIALTSNLLLKTGLSKDLVGYVMSAFSISVSLFMSLLVNIFDKFEKTDFDTKNKTDEVVVRMKQKKNFFKKFISITSYLVATSILIILLCSISYMLPQAGYDLGTTAFCFKLSQIDWAITLKCMLLVLYRTSLFYFLFNYLLLTFFVAASSFEYYISELDKVKI